jgi:hypothetical protein
LDQWETKSGAAGLDHAELVRRLDESASGRARFGSTAIARPCTGADGGVRRGVHSTRVLFRSPSSSCARSCARRPKRWAVGSKERNGRLAGSCFFPRAGFACALAVSAAAGIQNRQRCRATPHSLAIERRWPPRFVVCATGDGRNFDGDFARSRRYRRTERVVAVVTKTCQTCHPKHGNVAAGICAL